MSFPIPILPRSSSSSATDERRIGVLNCPPDSSKPNQPSKQSTTREKKEEWRRPDLYVTMDRRKGGREEEGGTEGGGVLSPTALQWRCPHNLLSSPWPFGRGGPPPPFFPLFPCPACGLLPRFFRVPISHLSGSQSWLAPHKEEGKTAAHERRFGSSSFRRPFSSPLPLFCLYGPSGRC